MLEYSGKVLGVDPFRFWVELDLMSELWMRMSICTLSSAGCSLRVLGDKFGV
jgi:hypothetical protein